MVARVAAAQQGSPDLTLQLLASATPAATAEEIASAFVAIGGVYAKIATIGAKFDVPKNPSTRGLLNTLKDAGRVTDFPKRPNREIYNVKVA